MPASRRPRSVRASSNPSCPGRPRSSTKRSGLAPPAEQRLERHAVGGGDHLVPGLAEKVDEHLADVPLVVDDGDARHVQLPATLLRLKQIAGVLATG